MRIPLRFFAFTATAVSGVAAGYGLVDRPPAQIVVTEAEQAALRPTAQTGISPIAPPTIEEPLTAAPDPDQADPWTSLQEAGAFDDLTNVYLSVPSDAPLSCGARRRASLMLRCLEDRTSIYVAHDCATPPIHSGGWDVDLRLDQNPVEQTRMQVDSRGEALGHWEYQEARILIERLTTADRLHMRFTDDSGVTTALQFPLTGLGDHLDDLRDACHWSDVPPWEIGPSPQSPTPETADIVNASLPEPAPQTPPPPAYEGYRLLGERLLQE